MKFGSVDNPATVDFTLPPTHSDTFALLAQHKAGADLEVYVGCAKWNKQDLKGFYPRGTKDELTYYATQFNSIELNGTFYNAPDKGQVETWKAKTPADFKFFPKVPQTISHYGRLLNVDEKMAAFCDAIVLFEEKLGVSFLQLHDNFKPKDFDRLAAFVKKFAKSVPLAVEVRNAEWFADATVSQKLYHLLETENAANVIVDTAGRRDMLHMRLTTPTAFVRYVGANHPTDKKRLDDWVARIQEWRDAGLRSLYFFVHQNVEVESPLLSTYFIAELNKTLGLEVRGPHGQLF
ncbi:DUF72 domain-containing protein [Parapedobacter koreensis]|uniref:Uncharacterized conserved protein YecE, DUF72 family n=1 Tax=Parapedobacter koreensis TaxID=332977 RepID=A0A1H7MZU0_9SPHI|nr:DUF72 domain-containing protein [Parapedobacter koreensis]SEL16235.1 Uncharacterized conserved protein YecE, DUF72 family [Parapedobacter koreensis]